MNFYTKIITILFSIWGDKRYKYYQKLMRHLSLDRDELIKIRNINIQNLVNYAYNNTIYYKELLDAHNINPKVIKSRNDLKKIPELTKKLLKENVDKIKATDHFGKNMNKVTSGGSTGELGVFYISKFYKEMGIASWLRNNSMIGWMPFDRTVWIWGSTLDKTNNFFSRLNLYLNRKKILNGSNYTEDDFPNWFETISKFKPKIVFGYSNMVADFSKYLLKNNLKLPSIKKVVSTSEKLKHRKIIEEAFNCSVYDMYGCREAISIGIEINPDQMLFTDDVVVANVNSKDEFLLTPLYSFGFPLINYKVGDIGEIKVEDKTSSKFPFPISKLKIGRNSDNFIRKDNIRISTRDFNSTMNPVDLGVNGHQIIQNHFNLFEVNYVTNKKTIIDNYHKKVTVNLEKYFGENLKINFKKVPEISLEKSGKLLLYKRTFNLD